VVEVLLQCSTLAASAQNYINFLEISKKNSKKYYISQRELLFLFKENDEFFFNILKMKWK
jgi:hypothetical protein